MQSICVRVFLSVCMCTRHWAMENKTEKSKYGQGSGEGLVNFPKAHYLLWEQGEIKRKKYNEIVFATKAHTYSCTPADLTLTWKLRHVGQTRGGWAAFAPSSSYLPVNGPTEKYETWTCCYLSLVWFFVATASPRYKWRCRYRYWRANTDTAHNQQQTQIHLHRYSMKCSKWLCGCKSGSWRMLRYVLRPIPPLDFMIKFYSFPSASLDFMASPVATQRLSYSQLPQNAAKDVNISKTISSRKLHLSSPRALRLRNSFAFGL